jgi:hypothetical protein
MKKLSFISAVCLVFYSLNSFAGIPGTSRYCFEAYNQYMCVAPLGVDDVKSGSHCLINKTVLLAKSADDCKKVGGKVVDLTEKK